MDDLQEFEFSVQYRVGKSYCNVDALSRLVDKECNKSSETSSPHLVSPVFIENKPSIKRLTTAVLKYVFMFVILSGGMVEQFLDKVFVLRKTHVSVKPGVKLNTEAPTFRSQPHSHKEKYTSDFQIYN